MHLLFVSRWYPFPPDNGSKLRVYNILRGLAKEHEITLLSFTEETQLGHRATNHPFCKRIVLVPWKPYNPKGLQSRLSYLRLTPRSIVDTYSMEMAACLRDLIIKNSFDCVIASQTDSARYRNEFRGIPAIFEEVELGIYLDRYKQSATKLIRVRNSLTWIKQRQYIIDLIRKYEFCTVVSDIEKSILLSIAPDYRNIEMIPNCIYLDDYSDINCSPESNTLIFTGSFKYIANYNAMIWFVNEVLPLIKQKVPQSKIIITGDHAGLPFPVDEQITLTGYVEDVRSLIAKATISIAPILQGGGTRLKILEAMALQTPVVATTKAVEGLSAINQEHLLVADTPTDFAYAVIHLLSNSALRKKLTKNAFQLIEDSYDWAAVLPTYMELIQKVVNQKAS